MFSKVKVLRNYYMGLFVKQVQQCLIIDEHGTTQTFQTCTQAFYYFNV